MQPDAIAAAYDQISLPFFSISGVLLVLLIVLPAASILGFLSGRANRARRIAAGREVDQRAGEASLGAIMALLGLLLAFSFGNSISLLDSRKSDIISEANALGTAFLRADFLPEPARTELREALYEYAQTRLTPQADSVATEEQVRAFLDRTLAAQAGLWPLTVEATRDLPPATASFVAGSVNDVLDAHQVRLRSLSVPVAELSQLMVLAAAIAALFLLGNRAGIAGRVLTWRTYMFAGLLIVVMMTIVDLQRGGQGMIQVDQSALRATLIDMEISLN